MEGVERGREFTQAKLSTSTRTAQHTTTVHVRQHPTTCYCEACRYTYDAEKWFPSPEHLGEVGAVPRGHEHDGIEGPGKVAEAVGVLAEEVPAHECEHEHGDEEENGKVICGRSVRRGER